MWESIIGHRHIITLLQSMLDKNRLPHALLFAGPAGVGKSLTASALGASVLCGSVQPCGHCSSCLAFARQSHAGFFNITLDGSSIKIDQIRAISHEAAMGSASGQGRVCIIHDAEKMTKEAANSLLKLLEEPPAGFYFILLASSTHALLSTILSRCLTIAFLPLPPAQLAAALVSRGYGEEEAQVAARLGGGRMGQALTILAAEGFKSRDEALALAKVLTGRQGNWFFETMAAFDKREGSEISELLRLLLVIFRDVAIIKTTGKSELLYNTDCWEDLAQLAQMWPEMALTNAVKRIRSAQRALAANANVRLTLEALLIELSAMLKEGERVANRCRNSF